MTAQDNRVANLNSLKPPSSSASDAVHSLAKVVISAIPGIGSPAAELFGAVVQPPLERRRDEWIQSVGLALEKLRRDGLDLDTLRNNEAFIDTALQATQIALRNHQEEKRAALRNAIMNTAIGGTLDDMRRCMFLRYVDEFTPEHLGILALFDDPVKWFERAQRAFPNLYMGGLSHVLVGAFPALPREIYEQIWRDLYQRGLVNTDGLHTMMTGLQDSRTTELDDSLVPLKARPRPDRCRVIGKPEPDQLADRSRRDGCRPTRSTPATCRAGRSRRCRALSTAGRRFRSGSPRRGPSPRGSSRRRS